MSAQGDEQDRREAHRKAMQAHLDACETERGRKGIAALQAEMERVFKATDAIEAEARAASTKCDGFTRRYVYTITGKWPTDA